MFFNRVIANHVKEAINGEKRVVIVYGPRQAGKTTLMKSLFLETKNNRVQFFVGDDLYVRIYLKETIWKP